MMGLLTGHCHLQGHLFKMVRVHSPRCERCKASEMASYVVTEELAVLGFRHLGHHFLNISVSKILHFLQSEGLLNA